MSKRDLDWGDVLDDAARMRAAQEERDAASSQLGRNFDDFDDEPAARRSNVPTDEERRAVLDRELAKIADDRRQLVQLVTTALTTSELTQDLTVRQVGELAGHIADTIRGAR